MTAPAVNARELDVISRVRARLAASGRERLVGLIGVPYEDWANRCHEISLALLRTGEFGRGRIARGFCHRVRGQHSWIVLGDDCYDPDADIVDPTLHAHMDVDGIVVTTMGETGWYRPHGSGSCFSVPPPQHHGGPDIELTPAKPLSVTAKIFLGDLGPLDLRGWAEVAHLPVLNWPAAEIIRAMCDTEGLPALIPVDIRGMLTDLNPGNYYW